MSNVNKLVKEYQSTILGALVLGAVGMTALAPSAQDVAEAQPVPDLYDDYVAASTPVVPVTVAFCQVGADGDVDVIDAASDTVYASTLGEDNITVVDAENGLCTYREPGRPALTLQIK